MPLPRRWKLRGERRGQLRRSQTPRFALMERETTTTRRTEACATVSRARAHMERATGYVSPRVANQSLYKERTLHVQEVAHNSRRRECH